MAMLPQVHSSIMPFSDPSIEQEFLLAYDSRPARIASDRWWAAVILAQTFIITYFNMLDPIPDHVQLAITAQGAGALLVLVFSFNNLYSDVYRRPILSMVRMIGPLTVLTVGPHLYLHLRVTSWWGVPKGFIYRIIFMYGRFVELAFFSFRWQLGMTFLSVTVQTFVVTLIVIWSHKGCQQLLQSTDIRERLAELDHLGKSLTPAAISRTCEVATGRSLLSWLAGPWSALCQNSYIWLGALARMPTLMLCVVIQVVLCIMFGLICPLAYIFLEEYSERKQFAVRRGLPVPPSFWPALVLQLYPIVFTVTILAIIDRVLNEGIPFL